MVEILSSSTQEEFRDKLLDLIRKWKISLGGDQKSLAQIDQEMKDQPSISIVIDGPTLTWALMDDHAANAFF